MSHEKHFLLLSSPPASGKTYWINEFITHFEEEILVISPLRALADECRANFGARVKVETPESWLADPNISRVVIFDEFHLLYYWGNSFRPNMWEAFFLLSDSCEMMIGLTATVSSEIEKDLPNFQSTFDSVLWCDHGNQRLKNLPAKYVHLPSHTMMRNFILKLKPLNKGVTLIFCGFRKDVFSLASELRAKGYLVWTCVGGEAAEFSLRVRSESPPQFILATTVLSHGVNLPRIVRIIFQDKVNCLDFWIQMVARGGRKGESYEVFSLEKPSGIKFNRVTNFLAILQLSFKMKAHQYFEHFTLWFLKA